MVKSPNWQEANQLTIYKRGRGVELSATEKQLQLASGQSGSGTMLSNVVRFSNLFLERSVKRRAH